MSKWNVPEPDQVLVPAHYESVFHPKKLKSLVRDCKKALDAIYDRTPFDGIATCGHSGNILGAALSYSLEVPLTVIRKACETGGTHHGFEVTGLKTGRVLLIDDLISSGATIRHMLAKLTTKTYGFTGMQPVGVMLTLNDFSPESWATRCAPHPALPVYYVKDVVQDRNWPKLAPSAIDKAIAVTIEGIQL